MFGKLQFKRVRVVVENTYDCTYSSLPVPPILAAEFSHPQYLTRSITQQEWAQEVKEAILGQKKPTPMFWEV